jgi:hypothetical protein
MAPCSRLFSHPRKIPSPHRDSCRREATLTRIRRYVYNEIRAMPAARPLPTSAVGLISEVIVTLGKRTTAAALHRLNDRQQGVRQSRVLPLHRGRFMVVAAPIAPRSSIGLTTRARIGTGGTIPTMDMATRGRSRLDSGAAGIRTMAIRITGIRTATPTTTAHRFACR